MAKKNSQTTPTAEPIKVGMISLGCAKNLVDAEIMLGALMQGGIEITNQATEADVLIINTCSFIDAAQEESVDTILESEELRKVHRPEQGLVVSGCLPQRFRNELPTLLPEVDAFMGIDQVTQVREIVEQALANRALRLTQPKPAIPKKKAKILETINAEASSPDPAPVNPPHQPILNVHQRPHFIPDYSTPRFRLTPKHFAYLKIAEGCNHPCTFCIIPRMRGSHRSRQPSDILQEATNLLQDGVKEINLISQDTTYYGLDLRPNHSRAISSPEKFRQAKQSLPSTTPTLNTLLQQLDQLPGDFWIRILYTHPAHWTDDLIQTLAQCTKVARYIDIPLQHIHEAMLERMRRETSGQYIKDLLARIREGIPGIALRTTFIVGFPGETEAAFESLLEFIHETRFERLGIFTYSQEDGTRAGNMAKQIPEEIRQERKRLAMETQRPIAEAHSQSLLGKTLKVLVENPADKSLQPQIKSWEKSLIHSFPETPAKGTKIKPSYQVSRSEADAPDIDGRVFIRSATPLPLGEFAEVTIVGASDYDLIAIPAKPQP